MVASTTQPMGKISEIEDLTLPPEAAKLLRQFFRAWERERDLDKSNRQEPSGGRGRGSLPKEIKDEIAASVARREAIAMRLPALLAELTVTFLLGDDGDMVEATGPLAEDVVDGLKPEDLVLVTGVQKGELLVAEALQGFTAGRTMTGSSKASSTTAADEADGPEDPEAGTDD